MRRFNKGVSVDAMPEPHLGYLMGIWGSAFSASFADILTKELTFSQQFLPANIFEEITTQSWGIKKHFSAKIPNFAYGLDVPSMRDTKRPLLEMIDSGHANNLPVEPLLHPLRNQDILIIVNAGINPANNLSSLYDLRTRLKERYGQCSLDVDTALGTPVTYWPSQAPGAPHIIHISIHKDAEYDPHYDPRTAPLLPAQPTLPILQKKHMPHGLMAHTVVKQKNLSAKLSSS